MVRVSVRSDSRKKIISALKNSMLCLKCSHFCATHYCILVLLIVSIKFAYIILYLEIYMWIYAINSEPRSSKYLYSCHKKCAIRQLLLNYFVHIRMQPNTKHCFYKTDFKLCLRRIPNNYAIYSDIQVFSIYVYINHNLSFD